MEIADLGDKLVEYEVCGAGEPVILIHGSAVANMLMPLMQEPALTTHYRVFRYHRRGYGGTTHSSPPVRIVDQARDCLDLMRRLGLSRAHLVGHSYGGVIAIAVSLEQPAAVCTLSLLEPALVGMVPSGANFAAALTPAFARYQAGDNRGAIDSFLRLVCGVNYRAELERVIPGALAAAAADASTFFEIEIPAIEEFWRTFSKEQAASIPHPILAAVGTASEMPLREGHNLVREWFKQVEVLELVGDNHQFPLTNARRVAEGLVAFLTKYPIV
jgi:pimeloyl-ACP methyl ester carboxylesterase